MIFSETFSIPELESGMNVDVNPSIKLMECKVINGRKIGIKSNIRYWNENIFKKKLLEIITDLNDKNIQMLNKNMKVNSCC